jgi:hypothetical protein
MMMIVVMVIIFSVRLMLQQIQLIIFMRLLIQVQQIYLL